MPESEPLFRFQVPMDADLDLTAEVKGAIAGVPNTKTIIDTVSVRIRLGTLSGQLERTTIMGASILVAAAMAEHGIIVSPTQVHQITAEQVATPTPTLAVVIWPHETRSVRPQKRMGTKASHGALTPGT